MYGYFHCLTCFPSSSCYGAVCAVLSPLMAAFSQEWLLRRPVCCFISTDGCVSPGVAVADGAGATLEPRASSAGPALPVRAHQPATGSAARQTGTCRALPSRADPCVSGVCVLCMVGRMVNGSGDNGDCQMCCFGALKPKSSCQTCVFSWQVRRTFDLSFFSACVDNALAFPYQAMIVGAGEPSFIIVLCSYFMLRCSLRTLHALLDHPSPPVCAHQFREAYNLALLHRLGDREEYRHCIQLLNMLSRQELTSTLERALQAVTGGSQGGV